MLRIHHILALLIAMNFSHQATFKPVYKLAFANFGPVNTDIFIADGDGSNARPLLPDPALDYNASISPDGKWIVFTSERNGASNLYRVHPDGSGLEQLTNDPSFDDQAAFSPDGRFLAFVSSRDGQADIYTLELATKKLTNITHHPAGDFRPCWSPDGNWIAFSSDRDSKKPMRFFGTEHSTEIYKIKSDGTGLTRLTYNQAFAGSPAWSSDGRKLVFYEAEIPEVITITRAGNTYQGTTQIATINLSDNSIQVITTGTGIKVSPRWYAGDRIGYTSSGPNGGIEFVGEEPGKRGEFGPGKRGDFENPSWTADGKRMVFHRQVDSSWPPLYKKYTMDQQFQLVRTGVFPSFSPSGDKLICNDQRVAILHNSILRMNADGSEKYLLFSDPKKSALSAVWSPKGDKIAFGLGRYFQMVQGPAKADIAVMDSNGGNLRVVTNGTDNFGFPSWSPDGKEIVYRVSGDSVNGLMVMNVMTGESRMLTRDKHDNFPSWSPTGEWIAFTGYRSGDYEIYIIRPDGTGLKRLTFSPGNDAHCSFSPDGQWIAFSSARGGFKDESVLHPGNAQPYGHIFVMRTDGSDVRRLTDNPFEEATPAWVPKIINE